MSLYTKNGKPLQLVGNTVFSKSGKVVGRIMGEKVFATDGRYVGTIIGNRLVYRSTQTASMGTSFSVSNRAESGIANITGSGIWGDEPNIPN